MMIGCIALQGVGCAISLPMEELCIWMRGPGAPIHQTANERERDREGGCVVAEVLHNFLGYFEQVNNILIYSELCVYGVL